MNYRVWFSIIATYLIGCWVGSLELKTEADEDLVGAIAMIVLCGIYIFASHRKRHE